MMINYINPDGQIVADYELEKMYDDMLDETGEWPTVVGQQFAPSRVLKALDSIAYREGLHNWTESEGYYEYDGR